MSTIELLEGEVRHTRLQPTNHSFRIAAFSVRIPVHELPADTGSRWFGINRKAVFSIRWKDYGSAAHDGSVVVLLKQLKEMIQGAGLTPPRGAVFLHTFPRMFGYVFNPVSFWFFHHFNGDTAVIVCEVNNTFGERHFYVLTGQANDLIAQGETLTAPKEFHVSPFFAVEGQYRFRFFTTATRTIARIDLDNSNGHALITSISGRRLIASDTHWRRILWTYRWFTVGVILKIHWQAIRLFIKRQAFFRKPALPSHIATRSRQL